MNSGERFAAVRSQLGLNQADMAEKAGVKRDSWRRYESGDLPTGETLERIAAMGFSIDWLLTGRGEMRPSGAPSSRAGTDQELLGRVIDGVIATYKAQGQSLAPINQGQVVGAIYDRLAAIEDDAERRGALRYALDQLRDELRRAAADPASSKRQA